MKLASIRSENPRLRNGELVVVSLDNHRAVRPESKLFTSLLDALEDWEEIRPKLENIYTLLNAGKMREAFDLDLGRCLAPITNAPAFFDGSAFLSHVVRARRSRGDEMPASARVTPLMYQGVSDHALSWNAPMDLMELPFGGDFEGEFAVFTTQVPKGCHRGEAHIALLTLFNDITYRELLKIEIETKFGFLQSKPNSSYAPIVVTPDELGSDWRNGRPHLELEARLNGERYGHPNGGEMHFSFGALIQHASRTRPLSAGSIIGSGTVSNEDKTRGFACITERRFQEILDGEKPLSPWLKNGDHVELEVFRDGVSVFGKIDQKAVLGQP